MKKLLFAAILVVLVSFVASAQDFPKVEVFGGYSIMKLGLSDTNMLLITAQQLEEWDATLDTAVTTSKWFKKGFEASATFNMNKYFGIEANFAFNKGTLGKAVSPSVNGLYSMDITALSALFGPHIAFRQNEKVTPFVHALFGLNHSKAAIAVSSDEMTAQNIEISNNKFGFALGGGLDINLNKNVAIRPIQFDYNRTSFDPFSGTSASGLVDFDLNNIVMSFGVVFKFGGGK